VTGPDSRVANPADFVGQESLVRKVFSRIGAERPQSVAIIGGSKSGKTSLLSYLSHRHVAAQHLRNAEAYVFFSYRASQEMTEGPETFLDRFSLRLGLATKGSNRYEGLRTKIADLHEAGQRMAVFLDDFHFITSSERFPLEFFSFLRSMANNYNLAYVTTSTLELQRLCIAKEIQESPFFNIFTNMHLGMLSAEDARVLLVRSAPQTDAIADRVISWCGGSPFVLNLAAAAAGKLPDGPSEAAMEKLLLPVLTPFFEEVVSSLPPAAAKPLNAVARGKAAPQSEVHQLSPLIKQGFLLEESERIFPFSPAFALFLKKEFSPRMLKGSC
jgi:ABC-type phosphonate transport system ATPase subunit